MSLEFPSTNLTDPCEILKFVAREIIRKEPRRYNQEEWASFLADYKGGAFPTSPEFDAKFPECGTICCVAGAVVLATKGRFSKHISWGSEAQKILGIDDEASEVLFNGKAIDEQLYYETDSHEDDIPERGSQEYAELGIRHIERFMRNYMGYEGDPL